MTRPPAIIVGGDANALSAARSLHRQGVRVFGLGCPGDPLSHSRAARWIRLDPGPVRERWAEFLLGPRSDALKGAVLLACSDIAIAMVIDHHAALAERFLLEEGSPPLRRALLDKLSTYDLAKRAGVPTPGYWAIDSLADLERTIPHLRYPVIVKPRHSPDSALLGWRKHIRAETEKVLIEAARTALGRGVRFLLMEFIPGPDSLLSSYYTYLDEAGKPLFEYTKIQPHRYPPNEGGSTFQETRWLPETAALGRRFCQGVGARGLINVEFKHDRHDGCLKIMECNARFTAANELLVRSGIDAAMLTYRRLIGEAVSPIRSEHGTRCLVSPYEDLLACLRLSRHRGAALATWLLGLLRADCFPLFSWRDPLPSLCLALARLGRRGQQPGLDYLPQRDGPGS